MIDQTVAEIEAMQTHSSSVVAIRATEALRQLLDRDYSSVEEFLRDLERNTGALRRANPSHASLYNAQHDVYDRVVATDPQTIPDAKSSLESAIGAVVLDIETGKQAAAANAAMILEDGMSILTHDYSTTVLTAIEQAVETGNEIDVFVTEARPRLLGRKTARYLGEIEGVSVTLIVDSAGGKYIDECDIVLMGMTCIIDETLVNRIGTLPLIASAYQLDIPAYVAGSSTKIVSEGFKFENDYRSAVEVMLEPTDEFSIANPSYDATPTRLLEATITDDGLNEP